MQIFWWVAYPYLAIACMALGTIYRRVTRPLGWSSKSSELLEKRWLRAGSLLFHWGILCVLAGHVAGLLMPIGVYRAVGLPDEAYHALADWLGGAAGLAATAGVVILLIRRVAVGRVRRHSSMGDWIALVVLMLVVLSGTAVTTVYNQVIGPSEYRTTVGPWLRSLLMLHPDPSLMAGVPLMLKLHVLLSFALFAVSPFTRLVHVWSAPVGYPRRPPVVFRARAASAAARVSVAGHAVSPVETDAGRQSR